MRTMRSYTQRRRTRFPLSTHRYHGLHDHEIVEFPPLRPYRTTESLQDNCEWEVIAVRPLFCPYTHLSVPVIDSLSTHDDAPVRVAIAAVLTVAALVATLVLL
jgi:hypothetical protein